jgi:predicted metal-binding membrane protein
MRTFQIPPREQRKFLYALVMLAFSCWAALIIWMGSPYSDYLHQTVMSAAPAGQQMVHSMQMMPWMNMEPLDTTSQTLLLSTIAFVGGWAFMVVAMMVPTIFPLLLAFRRATRNLRHARIKLSLCLGGFIAIWLVVGLTLFFSGLWLQKAVEQIAILEQSSFLVPAVTVGACGLYQFTRFKRASLARCRQTLTSTGADCFECATEGESLRSGVRHGLYSVGSCGAFMLLMYAADLGSIGFMALLAGAMLAERYTPSVNRMVNGFGLGLTGAAVIYGLVFLLRP